MDGPPITCLLRRPTVVKLLGVSTSTLLRIEDFPQPVRLGARGVAYREDEVRAWIERRTAARDERRSR